MVRLDFRVAVHLQVGERPLLVEDAQRDLLVSLDGLGLRARCHGRDQDVVAVEDVVHRRS